MTASADDSPIGPLADSCSGSLSVSVDYSGSPVITGLATCEWAGFGATIWPGGHEGVMTGELTESAEIAGDIVHTGAEVGTMTGTWYGCWVDGDLIGGFADTIELEYEGVIYPVEYSATFTGTLE